MAKRKVVVTGATGVIATRILPALRERYELTLLDAKSTDPTGAEVAGVTGQYSVKQKPVQSSSASYDPEAARRLWEISAELTGLTPHTGPP